MPEKFSQNVHIAATEGQFLMQKPVHIEDETDLYLVNKRPYYRPRRVFETRNNLAFPVSSSML